MIPKIVHQIYWNFKNVKDEIPIEWQKLYLDCKTMYEKNGWKHILWNKKQGIKLIYEYFPWLRKKYCLSSNIEKVDILKYAIMYVYGGMYIDLDTVCNAVFIPDENVKIMLGSTGMIDSFILNNFYSINNNIILSIPKHPFWESILHRINTSSIPEILPKIIYIFLHTGPYMLQNAYENYPDKKDITIYKMLSVGVHKSNTYFQHISKKSWVDVFDAVYLGYFLFIIIIIIFNRIVFKNTKIFFLIYIIISIFLVFLCRKKV